MLSSNLELDYSQASSEVQDLNTFLQLVLEKLFPKAFYIVGGDSALATFSELKYGVVSNSEKVISNSSIILKVCSSTNERGLYGICTDYIDVTNYSKLEIQFEYSYVTGALTTRSFGVALAESSYNSQDSDGNIIQFNNLQAQVNNTDQKVTLDLSNVTGQYKVFIWAQTAHQNTHTINVKTIKFSA